MMDRFALVFTDPSGEHSNVLERHQVTNSRMRLSSYVALVMQDSGDFVGER